MPNGRDEAREFEDRDGREGADEWEPEPDTQTVPKRGELDCPSLRGASPSKACDPNYGVFVLHAGDCRPEFAKS